MPQQIGVVGLAVMGENLVLNLADHGVSVAVFNRTAERTKKFIAGEAAGRPIQPGYTLAEFVGRLERPRKVLLMVKAGQPVDAMLDELLPHLAPGDLVIDGGNSLFRDTERRVEGLAARGFQYIGTGISGGEEGARHGPSIMPGGSKPAYELVEPMLKKIAAQTDTGPCVAYIGARGAGHFVKMVHNGIEYGDMQLICEAYHVLRQAAKLSAPQLAEVFDSWNKGELQSYLIEITARIVNFPDEQGTGDVLINRIEDKAGQKGTGKWTTQAALDLGLPIPTITAAVDARLLSALKDERLKAARTYASLEQGAASQPAPDAKTIVEEVRKALYAAKICSYAQGFAMMRAASHTYDYSLNLGEIARIWKGGCIIRAIFLDRIRAAFQRDAELPNLLFDPDFARELTERHSAWRQMVGRALQLGIPTPALSASLAYFEGYRSARLPAYLLQAQRDYFGAHTYERTDRPGTFHTDWAGLHKK